MPLPLSIDSTSVPVTSPSSDNLLMLMMITGGLLFICLILLIIVMIRSKAKRKKARLQTQGLSAPAPVVKVEKTKPAPVAKTNKEKANKKTVVQQPPVAETKPVNQPVKEEIKVPETAAIKEEPVKETKAPEVKEEKINAPEIKTTEKPVTETPVVAEKKEPVKEIIPDPYATTEDQKKKEIREAISHTSSKEDNLRLLQERLNELSKEKGKDLVTPALTSFTQPTAETVDTSPPTEDEKMTETLVQETEKQPDEVLAPFIEKINATEEIKNTVEQETPVPELTYKEMSPGEFSSPPEPDYVEELPPAPEVSLTPPFIPTEEQASPPISDPGMLIKQIDEEIVAAAEMATPEPGVTEPEEKEKTILPASDAQVNTPKDYVPKTFTEWLDTLTRNKK